MAMRIEGAGITHRGTVKETNEDCLAVGFWSSQETMETARTFEHELDLPFACIVCDGMGGHNDGEKASLLVAKGLVKRVVALGLKGIEASVRAVNAELSAHVREHPELAGMGSTTVGLAAHERSLVIFNVGDSRAYKLGTKGLMQLSTDDVMGDPGWKLGSGKERNTRLMQCFGGRTSFSDIVPNVHLEPVSAGSTYLLCCDGLYETVTEEEMAALITADLAASVEALMKAALEKNAKDNVTVALVRVAEPTPAA
jgi:serine/threonine protein phosphatase PrpC